MEETTNKLEEQQHTDNGQTNKTNKMIIMILAGFLAVFMGAFFAFFAVFSNMTKNASIAYAFDNGQSMHFAEDMFKQMDNMDREFDRMMNEHQKMLPLIRMNHNRIFDPENETFRSEETPNDYKFIINLKPFGNDEKNVDFKAEKNRITVSAKYKNEKNKNIFSSTSFYQSFSIPDKIDNSKIKKEKNGDKLVITVSKSAKNSNLK